MDYESLTLSELLEKRALEYGDKSYLLFQDQVFSYRKLNEMVSRVANGFSRLGVQKGTPVNMHLANRPEFVFAFLGLARIGAIVNPTNLGLTGHELQYIVNHADAEISITQQEYLETIRSIQPGCPKIRKIIVVDGTESDGDPADVGGPPAGYVRCVCSGARAGRGRRRGEHVHVRDHVPAQGRDADQSEYHIGRSRLDVDGRLHPPGPHHDRAAAFPCQTRCFSVSSAA